MKTKKQIAEILKFWDLPGKPHSESKRKQFLWNMQIFLVFELIVFALIAITIETVFGQAGVLETSRLMETIDGPLWAVFGFLASTFFWWQHKWGFAEKEE